MTTTTEPREWGCRSVDDPERPGRSTRNRAEILRGPIPAGGFGRPLTSIERNDLRVLGWRRVSNRARVVREVSDCDCFGVVYYPVANPTEHAYTSAGIHVRLGVIDEAALARIAATELGRRGGSARTPAKSAASRANGLRGGRPPKRSG